MSPPWGDGSGGLGSRSPLVGPLSSPLLLLKCPRPAGLDVRPPSWGATGHCPQGPQPCPSIGQARLSSPRTEVRPQFPSGAQLRGSFPQPSPARGAALSKLTEPALRPSSTPPAKMARDSSPGLGSRPPGVTPQPFSSLPGSATGGALSSSECGVGVQVLPCRLLSASLRCVYYLPLLT